MRVSKTTEKEVAEWMLDELKREETLYQETAVCYIEEKFGKKFTYTKRQRQRCY